MKKTIQQLLAAILTVTMLASLLIVPAAAERAETPAGDSAPVAAAPAVTLGETMAPAPRAGRDPAAQLSGDYPSWDFTADGLAEGTSYIGQTITGLVVTGSQAEKHSTAGMKSAGATLALTVPGPCTITVNVSNSWLVWMEEDAVHKDRDTCYSHTEDSTLTALTFNYTGTGEGTVHICTSSNVAHSYITSITTSELTASAALASTKIALKTTGSAADVSVQVSGGTLTALTASSSASGVATVTPDLANKKITVTPVAKGSATITVNATVGGVAKELTLSVIVTDPNSTLSTTKYSYDFNSTDDIYADGVTFEDGKFVLNAPHGCEGKGDLTLKIPEGKTASFTVRTCCYNAGENATIAGQNCTVGAAKTWREDSDGLLIPITEATGTVVLTFSDSKNNKVVNIHGLENFSFQSASGEEEEVQGNGKVDVWDFGAQQLAEADFNNKLTATIINTQFYKNTTAGSSNVNLTSFSVDGLSFADGGKTTSHRLRTSNTSLTRYDNSEKDVHGTDPYVDMSKSKYKGYIYSNSSGASDVNVGLVLNAGDKVTYMAGTNSSKTPTYIFTNGTYTASAKLNLSGTGEVEAITFYPPTSGNYTLYCNDDKLVVARIYRETASRVTVSGTITAPSGIPSDYKLRFTDQMNNSTVDVTPTGTSYSVKLYKNHTYAVSLVGANQYVVKPAVTVNLVNAASDTKTQNIEIKAVDMLDVTVTVTGADVSVPFKTDAALVFTPTTAGAVYVPPTVPLTGGTAKLETGVAYSLSLTGANDYSITSASTGVSYTEAGTLALTIALKATPAVTGKFITLNDVEGIEDLPTSVAVSNLKFTNVDDNYVYSGSVNASAGTYSANLRAGTYLASATVSGYEMATHVTVASSAVTRNLLFVSTADKPSVEWVKDVYVGYPSQEHNYTTMKQALSAVSRMGVNSEDKRVTIHIAPGTYREQLMVDTPYLTFTNDEYEAGNAAKQVKLTWYYGIGYKYYSAVDKANKGFYDPALAYDKYGRGVADKWGCTVYVRQGATAFRAENIIFENSFNLYVTQEELDDGVQCDSCTVERKSTSQDVKTTAAVERAAALCVEGNKSEFYNCEFHSSQDTLYTGSADNKTYTFQGYFKDCLIEGQTDYIFGSGNVLFENCTLVWKGYSGDKTKSGEITANRSETSELGYLLRGCTVTKGSLNVAAGYLGRNWGADAGVVFLDTVLDSTTTNGTDLIVEKGWEAMAGDPKNSRYKEYGTVLKNGTAAIPSSQRVTGTVITSKADADAITDELYLGSWVPHYYGDLSNPDKVTRITVAGPSGATSSRLNVGEAQTVQLTATVIPDTATEQGVTWTSDNAKVTVSDTGLVSIAADAQPATVTITATTKEEGSSIKGTYTITLLPAGASLVKPLVHFFDSAKVSFTSDNVTVTKGAGASGGFVYATGSNIVKGTTAKAGGYYAKSATKVETCAKVTSSGRKVTVTAPDEGTVTMYFNNETKYADAVMVGSTKRTVPTGFSAITFDTAAGENAYEVTPASPDGLASGDLEGLSFLYVITWTPTGYATHEHVWTEAVTLEANCAFPATTVSYCTADDACFAIKTTTSGAAAPTAHDYYSSSSEIPDTTKCNVCLLTKAVNDAAAPVDPDPPVTQQVTVSYNAKVGTTALTGVTGLPAGGKVDKGTEVPQPGAAPTKDGYTFVGWYVGSDKAEFPITANANLTITAVFTKNGDKTALSKKITAAETAKTNLKGTYTVADDTKPAGVKYPTKFVTETAKAKALADLDKAIAAAEVVKAKDGATVAEVNSAIQALTDAITNSTKILQTGTDGKPLGGGGSSADRGETKPTKPDGTVTNPDGSVTTVETKPDGSKVETTKTTDGATVETVTTKDGDVAITVTDAEGETLVDMTVPAAPASSSVHFEDVPEGHWAEKSINNMAGLGMVKGVSDDTYDMTSDVTRGSIATMFFRLAGGKEGKDSGFADVAGGSWYADAIGWASASGVVNGYDKTSFGPEDTITRQQLAVMITRFAGLIGLDTTADAAALNSFTDGSVTDAWAAKGMAWCVANGIIKGKGANVLDPTASVTRAEAAVMFDRMIALVK